VGVGRILGRVGGTVKVWVVPPTPQAPRAHRRPQQVRVKGGFVHQSSLHFSLLLCPFDRENLASDLSTAEGLTVDVNVE